ncbi:SDR family NAD(P)-dependent oxidoreductase [Zobellella maritima]|uniref:SDR family NAD(P)-dependent oxidoreductase n=1 Tax=Zobellella maritima TaxID=2059725 RepID=UPI000E300AFA|nr:SDR family NAD(P)-dependent oxidoreductase [Zobellella maritima]
MQIKDRVFVITGGGRGLGLGMALHLARQGGRLALIDNNEKVLAEAGEKVAATGARVGVYACDISLEDQVTDAFTHIRAGLGGVHCLVNNAGLMRDALLIKLQDGRVSQKMSVQQWQSVVDVNLTGSFLCGREAAAVMAEQGEGGLIVNISSVSRAGNRGQTNYSATKAGVAAMVVSWAGELSRYGIRVAGIAPGVVATDMTAQMKPEAIERLIAAVPMGRLGEIGEIAHSLQYIIENDYFNGRIIEIDGGLRV